jgi:hypothetical protein
MGCWLGSAIKTRGTEVTVLSAMGRRSQGGFCIPALLLYCENAAHNLDETRQRRSGKFCRYVVLMT